MIYESLLKPHLDYGLMIWGNSKHLATLEKAQKRAIRITCERNKYTHVEPLLKQLNLLNIRDMHKTQCLLQAKKIMDKLGPQCLQNHFTWNDETSRRSHLMTVRRFNSLTEKTATIIIPQIWNEHYSDGLGEELRLKPKSYRHYLTSQFATKYYDKCNKENCYSCLKNNDQNAEN